MALTKEARSAAVEHLAASDPVMKHIIDQVGPFTLRLERDRFWMLARSIISQQLSVGAARSIRAKLEAMVEPARVTPEVLINLSSSRLREAGISSRKAEFLHDLANKTMAGDIQLNNIGRYSDESIIEQLTRVKGIGRWTAQMFLIFALGREDVFPEDDLGVRAAIRNCYGFATMPERDEAIEVATCWRPYSSVASWYCWRSLDLARDQALCAKGS